MTRAKSYVRPKATHRTCCASLDIPLAEHADDCQRAEQILKTNHPNRPKGRVLNPTGNAKVVNFKIANSMVRTVDNLAKEFNVNRSTVMRVAIRYALKNMSDLRQMLREEPY